MRRSGWPSLYPPGVAAEALPGAPARPRSLIRTVPVGCSPGRGRLVVAGLRGGGAGGSRCCWRNRSCSDLLHRLALFVGASAGAAAAARWLLAPAADHDRTHGLPWFDESARRAVRPSNRRRRRRRNWRRRGSRRFRDGFGFCGRLRRRCWPAAVGVPAGRCTVSAPAFASTSGSAGFGSTFDARRRCGSQAGASSALRLGRSD